MGGRTPLGFIESLQVADFCKDLGFYGTYSGSQKSEVCPMPYALCPMPYALCPVLPHLSEKGYISNFVMNCVPTGDLQLGEIKSVETMIKNEKH